MLSVTSWASHNDFAPLPWEMLPYMVAFRRLHEWRVVLSMVCCSRLALALESERLTLLGGSVGTEWHSCQPLKGRHRLM